MERKGETCSQEMFTYYQTFIFRVFHVLSQITLQNMRQTVFTLGKKIGSDESDFDHRSSKTNQIT